jgi:hypothetical protein
MALLAAVLLDVSAPLAKALLDGVSPQVLAGLLYLGSESAWQQSLRVERFSPLAREPSA